MKVITERFYPPALDALPAPRHAEFQIRLLALTARAYGLEFGEDDPLEREDLADIASDFGDSLGVPSQDVHDLLGDVFDELFDPLRALLAEVRADAWPPRAQEALYACPFWVTLRLVDDAIHDSFDLEVMRKRTQPFLDALAAALGLKPDARERVEGVARALYGGASNAED
jgi:hypothetical protein